MAAATPGEKPLASVAKKWKTRDCRQCCSVAADVEELVLLLK